MSNEHDVTAAPVSEAEAEAPLIEPIENPAVDTSVEPVAPDAPTEGEILRDEEAPETTAALDAVGEHLMARGHGEGGLPLAAAVVEAAVAAPSGETRVNYKAHPPVATEAEAVAMCEKMPEGSFCKKNLAGGPKPYRVYEALHGA